MNLHTQQPAYLTAITLRYSSLLALATAAFISILGGIYFYNAFFGAIDPSDPIASEIITYQPQTLKLKQYEELAVSEFTRQTSAQTVSIQDIPNPFTDTAIIQKSTGSQQ
ncbi:MAG: hypothetical protein COW24_05810 [Candidatus Kerfeldbacteria bacterium CG15_BIG_FIL_POST_REV_8_21_14_020_45_12]|uniref:Uncharacterized protein n=1 Tax=Candidatus Kerfeldbacteria bacterium CG15_BIG_FIL_POST_REV_8_21_14_020_45_12 TaxID=2014247 RepID=A0A2M7H299_9BACT|nr:MAG: hypothetical protein COW24_05810 [Candidatus Kerfeldbacteria bacterium CG15_BIG_FIL_POST_REV_8_21_14_020_45_12]PJA93731.1 MAG: hypothetical protein CO132_01675 [Candidatus Kerfeldbacteria bacterium CG_4_9_14_3_um_filter_45_8]